MSEPEYIWITRWEDFQHYAPDRDRAPGWIKAYTKQLSDDSYLDLTAAQRGLLHDLRTEFARSHFKLITNTTRLSQRLGYKVYTKQLELLNRAGFIEFHSRESLDRTLEKFYASRAPDRAHDQDLEVEKEKNPSSTSSSEHIPRAVTELDQPPNPLLADAPANGANGPGEIESISSIIQRSLEEARNA